MTRLHWRTCLLVSVVVLGCFSTCMAYDALDPTGNVTIIWDVMGWAEDGYLAKVNIYNYQQFRKIDKPGWALTWNWTNGEFIWDMSVSIVRMRLLLWPHARLTIPCSWWSDSNSLDGCTMQGAEATQQGDCSQVQFPGAKSPHWYVRRIVAA